MTDKSELAYFADEDLFRELFSRHTTALFVGERISEGNALKGPIMFTGNIVHLHGMLLRAEREIVNLIDGDEGSEREV